MQRLAHQGLTLVRRWLSASRGQVAVVEPVQVSDSTVMESAQGSAPADTAVLEQGDIPAAWAAIEGNDSIAATLSEQAMLLLNPLLQLQTWGLSLNRST